MIQFRGCVTIEVVTENDVKEVIKRLHENAPKRKGGETKIQMIQMIGLIRPIWIKIWNCIVEMIFVA